MKAMEREDAEFYGAFAPELEARRDFLLDRITRVLDGLGSDSETAPAEHVKCRIKSAGSAKGKLKKLGLEESAASGLKNLSDIIGLRVVTHFVGDIYTVLERLRESADWQVKTVKDYIAGMTDRYAINMYNEKFVPSGWKLPK